MYMELVVPKGAHYPCLFWGAVQSALGTALTAYPSASLAEAFLASGEAFFGCCGLFSGSCVLYICGHLPGASVLRCQSRQDPPVGVALRGSGIFALSRNTRSPCDALFTGDRLRDRNGCALCGLLFALSCKTAIEGHKARDKTAVVHACPALAKEKACTLYGNSI